MTPGVQNYRHIDNALTSATVSWAATQPSPPVSMYYFPYNSAAYGVISSNTYTFDSTQRTFTFNDLSIYTGTIVIYWKTRAAGSQTFENEWPLHHVYYYKIDLHVPTQSTPYQILRGHLASDSFFFNPFTYTNSSEITQDSSRITYAFSLQDTQFDVVSTMTFNGPDSNSASVSMSQLGLTRFFIKAFIVDSDNVEVVRYSEQLSYRAFAITCPTRVNRIFQSTPSGSSFTFTACTKDPSSEGPAIEYSIYQNNPSTSLLIEVPDSEIDVDSSSSTILVKPAIQNYDFYIYAYPDEISGGAVLNWVSTSIRVVLVDFVVPTQLIYQHTPQLCATTICYQKITGKSIQECKEICDNDSSCVAFEYGVDHSGTQPWALNPLDCCLNSDANSELCPGFPEICGDCDGAGGNLDLYRQSTNLNGHDTTNTILFDTFDCNDTLGNTKPVTYTFTTQSNNDVLVGGLSLTGSNEIEVNTDNQEGPINFYIKGTCTDEAAGKSIHAYSSAINLSVIRITPGVQTNFVVDQTLPSATLTVQPSTCTGGCALTYELQQLKSDGSGDFEQVNSAFISNSIISGPNTIILENISGQNPHLSSTINLYISSRAAIINHRVRSSEFKIDFVWIIPTAQYTFGYMNDIPNSFFTANFTQFECNHTSNTIDLCDLQYDFVDLSGNVIPEITRISGEYRYQVDKTSEVDKRFEFKIRAKDATLQVSAQSDTITLQKVQIDCPSVEEDFYFLSTESSRIFQYPGCSCSVSGCVLMYSLHNQTTWETKIVDGSAQIDASTGQQITFTPSDPITAPATQSMFIRAQPNQFTQYQEWIYTSITFQIVIIQSSQTTPRIVLGHVDGNSSEQSNVDFNAFSCTYGQNSNSCVNDLVYSLPLVNIFPQDFISQFSSTENLQNNLIQVTSSASHKHTNFNILAVFQSLSLTSDTIEYKFLTVVPRPFTTSLEINPRLDPTSLSAIQQGSTDWITAPESPISPFTVSWGIELSYSLVEAQQDILINGIQVQNIQIADCVSDAQQLDDRTQTNLPNESCSWYTADNYHFCGVFDHVDFVAAELCCICGGGTQNSKVEMSSSVPNSYNFQLKGSYTPHDKHYLSDEAVYIVPGMLATNQDQTAESLNITQAQMTPNPIFVYDNAQIEIPFNEFECFSLGDCSTGVTYQLCDQQTYDSSGQCDDHIHGINISSSPSHTLTLDFFDHSNKTFYIKGTLNHGTFGELFDVSQLITYNVKLPELIKVDQREILYDFIVDNATQKHNFTDMCTCPTNQEITYTILNVDDDGTPVGLSFENSNEPVITMDTSQLIDYDLRIKCELTNFVDLVAAKIVPQFRIRILPIIEQIPEPLLEGSDYQSDNHVSNYVKFGNSSNILQSSQFTWTAHYNGYECSNGNCSVAQGNCLDSLGCKEGLFCSVHGLNNIGYCYNQTEVFQLHQYNYQTTIREWTCQPIDNCTIEYYLSYRQFVSNQSDPDVEISTFPIEPAHSPEGIGEIHVAQIGDLQYIGVDVSYSRHFIFAIHGRIRNYERYVIASSS